MLKYNYKIISEESIQTKAGKARFLTTSITEQINYPSPGTIPSWLPPGLRRSFRCIRPQGRCVSDSTSLCIRSSCYSSSSSFPTASSSQHVTPMPVRPITTPNRKIMISLINTTPLSPSAIRALPRNSRSYHRPHCPQNRTDYGPGCICK